MDFAKNIIDYAQIGDLSSFKKKIQKEGVDNITIGDLAESLLISFEHNHDSISEYILSLNLFSNSDINEILNEAVYDCNIKTIQLLIDKASTLDTTQALKISAIDRNDREIFDLLLPFCQEQWQLSDTFNEAIFAGFDDLASTLIPLLNQTNLNNGLIHACSYNRGKIIEKLIPHCPEKLFTNEPLKYVVEHRNLSAFKKIFDFSNKDDLENILYTSLLAKCDEGEKIIEELIPYCKNILYTNNPLKYAVAIENLNTFKKIFTHSNKDSLDDALFVSMTNKNKDIIDILFDYCDIMSVKDKIIKNKMTGESVDYFLQKVQILENREELKKNLQNITNKNNKLKQKPKIM